jgi:hypothetical protein
MTDRVLVGIARDAKAGAVVVTDGGPVYIDQLDAWPPDLHGRRVRVKGRLADVKRIPDPVNEKGEIVQGAPGTQSVLFGAVWEPLA